MQGKAKNDDKELYRQLRRLSWEELWTVEVPRFNHANPAQRSKTVAVIRAVGVVFAETGAVAQKEEVRRWLLGLLHDPCEKIRRYAMAALPKTGAGPREEAELLARLRAASSEREKKFLWQALEKIGGTATLESIEANPLASAPQNAQKVKARVVRRQSPSAMRLDGVLSAFAGLRVHLRGRRGLEIIVRDEVEEFIRKNGKFRFVEARDGLVAITPLAPFSLAELFSLRCFATVGFVPGAARANASKIASRWELSSPSPPHTCGGESRGEEAIFLERPLSPILSPLVPRGERSKNLTVTGFGSASPAGTGNFFDNDQPVEFLASIITSPLSRRILAAFTTGAIRYRLNFVGKGHQRATVRSLANRVYERCPEILNDARNVTWTMDLRPGARGNPVELRPNVTPDPRFAYRQEDVPAASHPSLAACLARLAGRVEADVVWDPFCGSGLELIERALLGGVRVIHGTDRSAVAIAIAQKNTDAARLPSVETNFTCCDFREAASLAGLGPGAATLILTNPPMGKRVPVGDLRQLIEDLFHAATTVLRPGGRLVLANPLPPANPPPKLKLESRQVVDFNGFDCRLEKYSKLAP